MRNGVLSHLNEYDHDGYSTSLSGFLSFRSGYATSRSHNASHNGDSRQPPFYHAIHNFHSLPSVCCLAGAASYPTERHFVSRSRSGSDALFRTQVQVGGQPLWLLATLEGYQAARATLAQCCTDSKVLVVALSMLEPRARGAGTVDVAEYNFGSQTQLCRELFALTDNIQTRNRTGFLLATWIASSKMQLHREYEWLLDGGSNFHLTELLK